MAPKLLTTALSKLMPTTDASVESLSLYCFRKQLNMMRLLSKFAVLLQMLFYSGFFSSVEHWRVTTFAANSRYPKFGQYDTIFAGFRDRQ